MRRDSTLPPPRVLVPHPGTNRAQLRANGFRGGREPRLIYDLRLDVCGHRVRGAKRAVPAAVCRSCNGAVRDVTRASARRVS